MLNGEEEEVIKAFGSKRGEEETRMQAEDDDANNLALEAEEAPDPLDRTNTEKLALSGFYCHGKSVMRFASFRCSSTIIPHTSSTMTTIHLSLLSSHLLLHSPQ